VEVVFLHVPSSCSFFDVCGKEGCEFDKKSQKDLRCDTAESQQMLACNLKSLDAIGHREFPARVRGFRGSRSVRCASETSKLEFRQNSIYLTLSMAGSLAVRRVPSHSYHNLEDGSTVLNPPYSSPAPASTCLLRRWWSDGGVGSYLEPVPEENGSKRPSGVQPDVRILLSGFGLSGGAGGRALWLRHQRCGAATGPPQLALAS